MIYPVGMIPYTNMEPYRQLGEPECCRFIPLHPRESIMAIKLGRVLAAAIPVGGLQYVDDLVEPIGQFGIATGKCSMSVLFFSKVPFTSINRKHKIQLTDESASSVKLLYLLLGYKNGFNNIPMISCCGNIPDGELVIGDKALLKSGLLTQKTRNIKNTGCNWPYITDLAQIWYEIKGYPFVFARWVIRKDVSNVVRNSINRWLFTFKEREEELVDKSVKVSARKLEVADEDVKSYFNVIRRTLNYNDLFGQKLFTESFKKHSREPLFENYI